MTLDDDEATRAAIEAVRRIVSPRLIAGLARITADVGAAGELAQDALVIALEAWPVRGVPDGPGAWLMATAERRAIDLIRRRARYEHKLREAGRDMQTQSQTFGEPDAGQVDDQIGEDVLRLIFIACHPVLPAEARAALTLRLIGGLTIQLAAVRGYLLAKLGRFEEARQEFNRAATLTSNENERTLFRAQSGRCAPPTPEEHP